MGGFFSAPLDVVAQVVSLTFKDGVELYRTDTTLEFALELTSLEGMHIALPSVDLEISFEANFRKDMIRVTGLLNNFHFFPWKGIEKFFLALEDNLDPFFEPHYRRYGMLELYDTEENQLILGYDEEIKYEALDDEELAQYTQEAIAAAVRTLTLVSPVMRYLLQHHTTPGPFERIKLLEQSFGMWEVGDRASDAPARAVRLPAKLFGGIGILHAQ